MAKFSPSSWGKERQLEHFVGSYVPCATTTLESLILTAFQALFIARAMWLPPILHTEIFSFLSWKKNPLFQRKQRIALLDNSRLLLSSDSELSYPLWYRHTLFPQVLNCKDSSSNILFSMAAGVGEHCSLLGKFSFHLPPGSWGIGPKPALLPCIRFSWSGVFCAMLWCAPVAALQSWYC